MVAERSSGNSKHASLDAWSAAGVKNYIERRNGIGQDLPNFCLKIPTGGGKTLLAVKTIDLINTIYRKRRTGLALWVMPTNQIYRQTLRNLRNRDHFYRQQLDIASGGKTLIVEKSDRFSPQDVEENLVVLMLMLPSASRQNKETLRMFRDSGGFQSFFPPEDNIKRHETLLRQIPNLDIYGKEGGFWGRQILTSLGNTLRLLEPVIILDEGHKAYSETAQKTLRGFNPSIIVELSATPLEQSNILVEIKGIELNREQMIKLDLHIINKRSPDWKNTLLASINHRNILEEKSKEYESNTGIYVRPICLIQVERTGKDQRDGRHIHAEDVREHLIKTLGIPPRHIAVKTSETDELKEVDDVGGLMSRNTGIRYIITKQALQEGWDCAFAYVLTILTNPTSQNALTQLVGRILRQPNARKTGISELDESYVFCFQQRGANLLNNIRNGFQEEGLGDLTSRLRTDEGFSNEESIKERTYGIRKKFQKAASRTILPVFVIREDRSWRTMEYSMDIESQIPWRNLSLKEFDLTLTETEEKDTEHITTLSEDTHEVVKQRGVIRLKEGGLTLDPVFLARHLLDVVPNPWMAFVIGQQVLEKLFKKYDEKIVINNFVFIIEELQKFLEEKKDAFAENVFRQLLRDQRLRFVIIGQELGFQFPASIAVKSSSRPLFASDNQPLQRSLFEFVAEESVNETEKAVAWYLEGHDRLYFWFRNVARQDYALQGWKKHKVYPDFIFTSSDDEKPERVNHVYVIETKGLHLMNEDTEYKRQLFDLCNDEKIRKNLDALDIAFKDRPIAFEVVSESEWQRKLNELLSN